MIKKAAIQGKEVEYDDKEFEVLISYDKKTVDYLLYKGNGFNIKNPKGNITCESMFDCEWVNYLNIYNLDLSEFNTQNIIDMYLMFGGYPFEELDLSNFDTQNVKDMSKMFIYSDSLQK